MIDEIFDRNYQSGRAQLHGGLDRLFRRIGRWVTAAFEAGHRVQFDSPWSRPRKSGCA